MEQGPCEEMATIYVSERLGIHHSLRTDRKHRERKAGLMNHRKIFSHSWICLLCLKPWNPWWPRIPPSRPGGTIWNGWWPCFCASLDRLHCSKPHHLYPGVQAATIFIQASAKQLPSWLTHPAWVSFSLPPPGSQSLSKHSSCLQWPHWKPFKGSPFLVRYSPYRGLQSPVWLASQSPPSLIGCYTLPALNLCPLWLLPILFLLLFLISAFSHIIGSLYLLDIFVFHDIPNYVSCQWDVSHSVIFNFLWPHGC